MTLSNLNKSEIVKAINSEYDLNLTENDPFVEFALINSMVYEEQLTKLEFRCLYIFISVAVLAFLSGFMLGLTV